MLALMICMQIKVSWRFNCRDADLGPSAQFYADGLQDSFNQLDAIFADSATDDEVCTLRHRLKSALSSTCAGSQICSFAACLPAASAFSLLSL